MRLVRLASETDFAGWRNAARTLRLQGADPREVSWTVGEGGEAVFYDDRGPARRGPGVAEGAAFTVPTRFVALAEAVFRHRSPERFGLLYRLLWRLAARPGLLEDLDDPDVARARHLARDAASRGNLAAPEGISPDHRAAESNAMAAPVTVSDRARKAAQRASRDAPWEAGAPTTLEELAAAVDACRRCDLW